MIMYRDVLFYQIKRKFDYNKKSKKILKHKIYVDESKLVEFEEYTKTRI